MIRLSAVMCSEDVLFQWCLLTADADNANGKDLLQMIVKLYITIRGFSFASSCVELLKNANKTLQKMLLCLSHKASLRYYRLYRKRI